MQGTTSPSRPLPLSLQTENQSVERIPYEQLRTEAEEVMIDRIGISRDVATFALELIDELHTHHDPSARHCLRVALLYFAYTDLQLQDVQSMDNVQIRFLAALLHDYSKSMIPVDEVLDYPGDIRQIPEKWGYILAHPELSARLILKRMEEREGTGQSFTPAEQALLTQVADVTRYHHMFAAEHDCYPPELAELGRTYPEEFMPQDIDHFLSALYISIADHFDSGLTRTDTQHELMERISSIDVISFFMRVFSFFQSPEILMRVLEAAPDYTRQHFGRDEHNHRETIETDLARVRIHILNVINGYYTAARGRYSKLPAPKYPTQLSAAG